MVSALPHLTPICLIVACCFSVARFFQAVTLTVLVVSVLDHAFLHFATPADACPSFLLHVVAASVLGTVNICSFFLLSGQLL
jgi:hypothetical protein